MTDSSKAARLTAWPRAAPPVRAATRPGSRSAQGDARWGDLCTALAAIRNRRRHAVRIVDADCACGTLLIEAARHAASLGFTAVEAHGIDGSPALIGRAREAAARFRDPAIGVTFEVADLIAALANEADFPADIVLWSGSRPEAARRGLAEALAAAGHIVIDNAASRRDRVQPS